MQRHTTFSIISTLLILLFILFAVVHSKKSVTGSEHHVQEHAHIVANSVWNLNHTSAVEYLNTIAANSDYKRIAIHDMNDKVFAIAEIPLQSGIDRILVYLHLIPEVPLTAPIVYKDHEIGHMDAIWRNTSIYLYFYTFLVVTLFLSTLYLYLRMLDSKKNLEKEVLNRTRTLQESEQRFQAIFDNHYQFTGLVSPDAILISANRASLELIDCEEEDIAGLSFCDCPWWPKGSALHDDVKQAVHEAQAGKFVRLELSFKDFTDVHRVVDFSLKPVFNKNNNLLYIIPEGRDITILKQAQQETIREQLFTEAVIESLPGIFYVCNEKMQLIRWNKSFEHISGYSPDELTFKSLFDFFLPEQKEFIFNRFKERINKKTASPIELATVTKDGSQPLFLFSSSMVEVGGTRYLIGTGIDISDRKKMETELRQAQKMEAIGTLAGGIAHDFNNILSAIIGYTELSQMEMQHEPRVSSFLAGIHQAAIRARDLIQQILTFSRKQDNSRLPLQIAPLLNEALRLIRSSIPTTINIETDIGARQAMVLADPTQIHRVFVNLCTNGYQAIGDNTGTLKISLQEITVDKQNPVAGADLTDGEYIRIRVSDSGRGMDKETMQRIFEPYFTTKEAGKGTGLGLALVDSIIREHDGEITVDSSLDRGTIFSLYLPIITKKPEDTVEPQLQSPPAAVRGHYIVCVDDEPYLLSILEEFLREEQFRITTFTTGTEALEYIHSTDEPVDLVITDMTMPNMTGLELGRRILAEKPQLPVLLCTGYSRSINREKALAEGFSRYIEKPVILADLVSAIREVLAEKTAAS